MHIGRFQVHETVLYCKACSGVPIHSEELAALVAPGANFAYDVMVYCGIARFQRHCSEEEVVRELAEHNVSISASEVRNLVQRFAAYLAIAHAQAGPAIADHLALNGGYILHLDSTSRLNSRKIMTGIDEISGLVLLNIRLTSETAQDVTGFLRAIIQSYGKPLAVASDMAASIRSAITNMDELTGIPHFICHFHFLRDAGKDLFQEEYRNFEKRLESHGATKILKEFRRSMESQLADDRELIDAFIKSLSQESPLPQLDALRTAALLAESALRSKQQTAGYGSPFDRPALTYYEHLKRIAKAFDALRRRPGLSRKEARLINRLTAPLESITGDNRLADMAQELRSRASTFDELRTALRLAPADTPAGLNHPGADSTADITAIEQEVKTLRDRLDTSRPELLKLQEQLDRHWHGLFHPPITTTDSNANEHTIYPQRTNNILEQFFRAQNHAQRRRTGVELSAARFDAIPIDSFLACNLTNPTYKNIILDGADDLPERFSRIDPDQVRRHIKEANHERTTFASPRKARKTLTAPQTPLQIAVHELANHLEILAATHNVK